MSTFEISGKKYPVRPLVRGEIRELRSLGLWVTQLSGADNDLGEASIDAVLDMVIGSETADALPSPEAREYYIAIIAATMGAPDAEKNSSRSGNGPPTRSETATAGSAGATTN